MKNRQLDTNLTVLSNKELEQVYGGNFDVTVIEDNIKNASQIVDFDHWIKEQNGSPVKPKLPIEL
jgi:bacteriocin-like protein